MRGYQVKIQTQDTPNPNALKFILNRDVKRFGKVTFTSPEECVNVPLAQALLNIHNATQVHFFENVITVTQNGDALWEPLENLIRETILANMEHHDVDFQAEKEPKSREHLSPELQKIEEILDNTIRPGLQADGGDVQVLGLDGKTLAIHYEGACGTCPSSTMGTLQAIEGILRDEFDAELEVVAV